MLSKTILQPLRDLPERAVQRFLAFFFRPFVGFRESRNEKYRDYRENEESYAEGFEPFWRGTDFAVYLYWDHEKSEKREPVLF